MIDCPIVLDTDNLCAIGAYKYLRYASELQSPSNFTNSPGTPDSKAHEAPPPPEAVAAIGL